MSIPDEAIEAAHRGGVNKPHCREAPSNTTYKPPSKPQPRTLLPRHSRKPQARTLLKRHTVERREQRMTIIEFLQARINEDEGNAKSGGQEEWA